MVQNSIQVFPFIIIVIAEIMKHLGQEKFKSL